MNDILIEQLITSHLLKFPNIDPKRITKPNVNYTPPTAGVWMRVFVKSTVNIVASVTAEPCVIENGLLIIQVFDRENNGTGVVKAFASALAGHFNCKQLGSLNLWAATINDVGLDGNGFYQFNVSVPYEFLN